MEYERTEDGQIQAAFAMRVGKVLLHYEGAGREGATGERYEATLCICLLQAVLTICVETMRRKRGSLSMELDRALKVSLSKQPARFGFGEECVEIWGHDRRPPSYRGLIEVIRNALSHPTSQSEDGLPTTGYTTVLDGTGLIESLRFVMSPWVGRNGGGKRVAEKEFQRELDKAKQLLAAGQAPNFHWRKQDGAFCLELEGQPFAPHTIVTLSVLQLRTLKFSTTYGSVREAAR